jgi:RNA polymerase sigma-70 factor (ECF subfamily)
MMTNQQTQKKCCIKEHLFQAAKQGDRHAFDALQQQLLPSLERFVIRLIGVREEMHDVVREAMIALWVSRHRLPDTDSLLPFLYRVARNKAYDVLRAQGRFDIIEDSLEKGEELPIHRIADSSQIPEDVLLRLLLWQEVQRAMDCLPEPQRQTMILYAEEDFTYQQIADATATDIGTVRSRLFHARRNIVRHLRPDTREALNLAAP